MSPKMLTRSVFDLTAPADLDDYLKRCLRYRPALDVARTRATAIASVKDLQTTAEGKRVEAAWYASLAAGGPPDYSVYESDFFIGDVWTCWVLFSRKYVLALRSVKAIEGATASIAEMIRPVVTTVADLGCGFGYSTAALKETFPAAAVYGTNLKGTCQWAVGEEIGAERDFRLVEAVHEISGPVDLVFASEYFEHIEEPVEHVEEILRVGTPKVIVVANTFRTPAVGHFNVYRHRGEAVPGTVIGRIFSASLRAAGYEPVKTKLWNNRPNIWVRK